MCKAPPPRGHVHQEMQLPNYAIHVAYRGERTIGLLDENQVEGWLGLAYR